MSTRAPSNSPQINDPDNSDIIKVIQPYMRKDIYDVLEDGTVDNSTRLGTKTLATIEAEQATAIALTNVPNQAHILNTGNPHGTTPTHLNLGNVDNTSDASKVAAGPIFDEFATKLDAAAYNAADVLDKVKTVDGSGSGLDADIVQGIDGSDYTRLEKSASGTPLTAGWMTIAQGGSGRFAGTVTVSDNEPGNHSFIEINFMQSYSDSRFNVVNVGGYEKRITGVRVLRSTVDPTYSSAILQVFVTVSSLYSVSISNNLSPDYLTLRTTVVDTQDTIADYAVLKEVTGLDSSSFATSDGVKINGALFIQNNEAYHTGNLTPSYESGVGSIVERGATGGVVGSGFAPTHTGVYVISSPGGGSANLSSFTGAIRVTMPTTWTSSMCTFKITVFEYGLGKSFEIFAAGYNYVGGYWVNCSAYLIGEPGNVRKLNVRFAHDGAKCCLLIGDITNTWTNAQVHLSEFTNGFSNRNSTDFTNGWGVSSETVSFDSDVVSVVRIAEQVGRTINNTAILYEGMDSGWLIPTLLNGWVPILLTYGSEGVRYKKYPSGLVEVQLGVKLGLYGVPIATLPIGYRPDRDIILSVMVDGVISRVDIRSDGSIFPYDNAIGNGWLAGTLLYYGDV